MAFLYHCRRRVEASISPGDEVRNRGVPVARLVPVPPTRTPRVLGIFRGQFCVPDDFDAPLPDELLDLFEGRKKKRSRKTKKDA